MFAEAAYSIESVTMIDASSSGDRAEAAPSTNQLLPIPKCILGYFGDPHHFLICIIRFSWPWTTNNFHHASDVRKLKTMSVKSTIGYVSPLFLSQEFESVITSDRQ